MSGELRVASCESDFYRGISFAAGISLVGTIACRWAAGATLGLFFGGFFVVTFVAPAVALWAGHPVRRLAFVLAGVIAVAAVWLCAVFQTDDTLGQWLELTAVLGVYGAAIAGIAAVLGRVGLPGIFAMGIAVVVGIVWMSWPVWLAPEFSHFSAGQVDVLVHLHPPLVANGVLVSEPAWTERSIAYHLTNLNQDMPIRLAHSAGLCATAHLAIAAAMWGVAGIPRRKKA